LASSPIFFIIAAMKTCRFSLFFACIACFALSLGLTSYAQAAGKRKNPASKIFVAETKGETQIDTGEKIEPLTVKSVHSVEGSKIETKADSSSTLVFSNGSSIIVGPNSRIEVKKFLQEPFTPNRNDLDVEPSISQTVVKMLRGSIGICTSRLVAGSSMSYQTPHGTVTIRGHKIMIEVAENETVVSLLEGDVTVLGDDVGTSQNLKPGQQAIMRKVAPGQPSTITIQTITPETNTKTDEQVSLACIARRTVYFETANREGSEIRPVEVKATDLPTQFTISPARLP
jgi:hypothetical protein